jgi:hypothetical protein
LSWRCAILDQSSDSFVHAGQIEFEKQIGYDSVDDGSSQWRLCGLQGLFFWIALSQLLFVQSVHSPRVHLFQILVDNKAALNTQTDDGSTALMRACSSHELHTAAVVQLLVEAGAQVDLARKDGLSVRFLAFLRVFCCFSASSSSSSSSSPFFLPSCLFSRHHCVDDRRRTKRS